MKNLTLHCTIKVLAPLHLGTGEEYEPMGFVLDADRLELHVFDPSDFAAALPQDALERFKAICLKGTVDSILELYRFYNGNLEVGKAVAGRVVPVCRGLAAKYRDVLAARGGRALNEMRIGRTAWLPGDGRPYIPGSAIKGAMRTAYLDSLPKQSLGSPPQGGNRREVNRYARQAEQRLLHYQEGKFQDDPFRLVQVSDFRPVGEAPARVLYAVNVKKNKEDPGQGPPQVLEAIEPGALFSGTLTVKAPPGGGIHKPVDWDSLARALDAFYSREKKREDRELGSIGAETVNAPDVGSLLRLGRHSGAECLTLEGLRRIQIKQRRGYATLDHATTLWLAGGQARVQGNQGLAPFGWVALEAGGPELDAACREKEAQWQAARKPAPVSLARVQEAGSREAAPPPPEPKLKDALLRELSVMKPQERGPLGSVVQRIPELESPEEKAEVARAVKELLGSGFKKYKQKQKISAWIQGQGD